MKGVRMGTNPPPPARREVSTAGKFLGLSIIGSAVVFVIFLEKFGSAEWLPQVKWILLGALVAGLGIPWLFFRRRAE